MLNLGIVLAILISIFLGYKLKINTGIPAIIFAYLIGCFGMGLSTKEIISAWPVNIMFSIMAVTFFYGFALENGTLEMLSIYLLYIFRKFFKLLPFLLFFVAMFITAMGAGNFAVVAFMAPLTMLICDKMHMSKIIGAISINAGSLAGGNFMTSNLGVIFRGLMDTAINDSGLFSEFDSFTCCLILFCTSILFSVSLIAIFRFGVKGNRNIGQNFNIEKPQVTAEHKKTMMLMATMLAIVLLFPITHIFFPDKGMITMINKKIDVSLVSMVFVILALILKIAPQKAAFARIPWSTILMVCGVGMLIQIAITAGTIKMLGQWVTSNIPTVLIPVAFGVIAGIMSFFSSTIGVVAPTLFPLIPGIAAATNLNPYLLFVTTVIGSQSTAISPFSASGSLIVGCCTTEKERNELFNRLITRAVPVSMGLAVAFGLIMNCI